MAQKWENETLQSILVPNWLEIVRQHFIASGLNSLELSETANLSRDCLSRLFNGDLRKRSTLDKVVSALGFEASSLFLPQFRK